jgi:phosphatidylserine decarboxylase
LTLTKFGIDVLVAVAIIAIVLIGLAIWADEIWLRIVLVLVASFIVLFSLNFFRDPDRTPATNGRSLDTLAISPADGKVVILQDVVEAEYLKGPAKMISIFMNPLDVHVNRSPMTGVVDYFRYVKGEFLVASLPEASHRNERAIIGLNANGKHIMFSQIAGYVARRIVCPVKVGDTLEAGKRFGMIKFGSRVDIFLPPNAHMLIKMGDIVKAGETVLAELP